MSLKYLPENIELYPFAEQKLSLDGLVKVADMHRLRSSLAAIQDDVHAHLQFGIDDESIPFLKGNIQATLMLQCQRCLDPFNYEVSSTFMLGIVESAEQVNKLPAHYEPAFAPKGKLVLTELIEDELILNLPIIPKHEPELCQIALGVPSEAGKQSDKESPFAVLKALKEKDRE